MRRATRSASRHRATKKSNLVNSCSTGEDTEEKKRIPTSAAKLIETPRVHKRWGTIFHLGYLGAKNKRKNHPLRTGGGAAT